MSQKGCKVMNSSLYANKSQKDNPNAKKNIIPVCFPPLRDPAQPLGKKIEPGKSVPDPSKYGPMPPRMSYATMF